MSHFTLDEIVKIFTIHYPSAEIVYARALPEEGPNTILVSAVPKGKDCDPIRFIFSVCDDGSFRGISIYRS